MDKILKLTISLVLLLNLCPLHAYNIRQVSNNDGLTNSTILSVTQDKDGLVWIGTCDGLNLYDGSKIKPFGNNSYKKNLSGNLIKGVFEGENDDLWICTNYGLDKINKKTNAVSHYSEFKGNYLIRVSHDNEVFVLRTDNEVSYYDEKTSRFENIYIENMPFDQVLNYTIDSNGYIWFFMKNQSHKIFKINKGKDFSVEFVENIDFVTPLIHCSLAEDRAFVVDENFILREFDLLAKKSVRIETADIRNELNQRGEISSVVKYKDSYFVGFKSNGLIRIDKDYSVNDIDIEAGITCFTPDRFQDILWIGTDGQGVLMYTEDSYSFKNILFSDLNYNINKPVRAIYQDHNDDLWVGTKGNGILKIDGYSSQNRRNKSSSLYTTANSELASGSVYSFGKSDKNILWIGTEKGLNYYSYNEKKIRKFIFPNHIAAIRSIHSINQTSDSTLWLATLGQGFFEISIKWIVGNPVYVDSKRFSFQNDDSFSNHFTSSLNVSDSIIWFGNRGFGAYKVNKNSYRASSIKFDQNLNNQMLNDVSSMVKDGENNLWFGTSAGLVKMLSAGGLKIYRRSIEFPDNTIHSILKGTLSDEDCLWIGMDNGLVRFDMKNESVRSYNRFNGLQITEFSDGAAYKNEKTGELIFGGVGGLVSIFESSAGDKVYRPSIQFEALSIFGKDYNISDYLSAGKQKGDVQTLKLDYKQNFFSLSFAAHDYIDGNNYNFYYKLEGASDQWVDLGSSRAVYFTNMKYGKYTLQVKYINKGTNAEGPVQTLIIEITPPWCMTTWAYMIYMILLLLLLIFGLKRYNGRLNQRRQAVFEKIEQNENLDIEKQIDTSEIEVAISPTEFFDTDPLIASVDDLLDKEAKEEQQDEIVEDAVYNAIEKQIEPLEVEAMSSLTESLEADSLVASFADDLLDVEEELDEEYPSIVNPAGLAESQLMDKEQEKLMNEMINVINKNLTDKRLSSSFVAKCMNMSTRTLYRKISEIGGISLADMIRDARVDKAEELLLQSKMTIEEVVYKSGFANTVSFYKAFKIKHGCTPNDFRQRSTPEL